MNKFHSYSVAQLNKYRIHLIQCFCIVGSLKKIIKCILSNENDAYGDNVLKKESSTKGTNYCSILLQHLRR